MRTLVVVIQGLYGTFAAGLLSTVLEWLGTKWPTVGWEGLSTLRFSASEEWVRKDPAGMELVRLCAEKGIATKVGWAEV